MTHYLDTSLLIALYAAERGHERLAEWLFSRFDEQLVISLWTQTEFSSALSLKLRTRQIDPPTRDRALNKFRSETDQTYIVYPVLNEDFDTAARWCERHETGLRAGDALHLAIARRNNATLCTLDRKLYDAGQTLGIQTLLV